MNTETINPNLYKDISKLGARDMEACMQCGNCAASCPLSKDENTFPRKIYRYLQLGLTNRVLESPEPWLCYYCGDCNTDCPRGAEPAETMMATRRWLTTQYDWTGLASKFYASPKWEVGAFLFIMMFVVSLFLIFHGPVVTDRVELNTFAPAHWVHLGDEIMIFVVMVLLLSNGFNMYRKIMGETKIPLKLFVTQAPVFFINYFTQKQWRKCGTGPSSAWWRHLFLFSGWVAMEVLVMIFLTSFQTDIIHPFWHPTRIVGYYATIALMVGSGSMLYSRWFKKDQNLHRYSDFTDMFFLILIFIIAVSGILVHILRLAGWPLTTYTVYVLHVGICVGMLMIMLPFGKLSHLLYRPLAIFLTTLKEHAKKDSKATEATIRAIIGNSFQSCMQCGTCTATCLKPKVTNFSPRQIIRNISLNRATQVNADEAAWNCSTCNSCVDVCPRGIPISELMKSIRRHSIDTDLLPQLVKGALVSLKENTNPWFQDQGIRQQWYNSMAVEQFTPNHDYCLFTCCTSVFGGIESSTKRGAEQLIKLLKSANVSFGTLGSQERCCGDIANACGDVALADSIGRDNSNILQVAGVKNLLTNSPHCHTTFNKILKNDLPSISTSHYTGLLSQLIKTKKLIPSQKVDLTVTYHDPCYLGRHQGIYDAPRLIIRAIKGVQFTEMQNTGPTSTCCGGGGSGIFQLNKNTQKNATMRLKEAMATGSEILVTSCPYCLNMFDDSIKENHFESRIKVMDISELLALAIPELETNQTGVTKSDQEELHV